MTIEPTWQRIRLGRIISVNTNRPRWWFGASTIPASLCPEAEAYKRDVPDAEVHILEAGHFALDEAVDEIAALMRLFLEKAPH